MMIKTGHSGANGNEKNRKIPKGYRLKISTHKKIKELQVILNGSQETVVSRAIRFYMKEMINKKVK